MNKMMVMTVLGSVVLLAGCSERPAKPISLTPVTVPPAFVDAKPEGTATPIPQARKMLNPGDEVLLEGLVMGVLNPFVDGRAVFVLGDEGTITPCDAMAEDHCSTPWDACCDPKEVRAAGTATIQVLGDDGKVLGHGLKGVGGLKESSRVTVRGIVAPISSAAAFVVNAKAVYVAP
jgi:hypothetical protein